MNNCWPVQGLLVFSVGHKARWQGCLVIHMTPKFRFRGTPKTIHKVVRACPDLCVIMALFNCRAHILAVISGWFQNDVFVDLGVSDFVLQTWVCLFHVGVFSNDMFLFAHKEFLCVL